MTFTPIDSTPLADLIRERAIYDAAIQLAIDKNQRPHPLLYDALLAYDATIARRMHEAKEAA
jgi:hypothetical protein